MKRFNIKEYYMGSKKKKEKALQEATVLVTLDYPVHFEGVHYEEGDYEVSPVTAKRLKEINKQLNKENK
jgi:hypothetical protein